MIKNEYSINNSDIYTLTYTEEETHIENSTVSVELESDNERFISILAVNPRDVTSIRKVRDVLKNNKSVTNRTIEIDYRLLTGGIIELLEEAYSKGYICGIRITPEGYTLTKEVFEKFNCESFDDFLIATDYIESDLNTGNSRLDLRLQKGICNIERIVYNEMLADGTARYHYNTNIHITKKLSDSEIKELVEMTKLYRFENIFVDFYDPSYYKELLLKLGEYELSSNIEITFLGNPIKDSYVIFSSLSSVIGNKINVKYSTSESIIDKYYEQPITEAAQYYSEIEICGEADAIHYFEMLNI